MNFGWIKDKWDERDYLHTRTLITLPDKVDLSQYLPAIRDQGQEGSCVGFGEWMNVTAWARKLGITIEELGFSPRDIYNGARFIEGRLNKEGAYPKDGFEWMLKKGCLLDHFWPYKTPDNSAPSSAFDSERAKWPLEAYFRVTDGVDNVCDALAAGNFVSIGCPWADSWMMPPNGILPEITKNSTLAGGHETCFYGYDRTTQKLFGANSWGATWGDKGCYQMPFSSLDVFKQIEGYDCHYVKVNWPFIPPTPPEPSNCEVSQNIVEFLNELWKVFGRKTRFQAIVPR